MRRMFLCSSSQCPSAEQETPASGITMASMGSIPSRMLVSPPGVAIDHLFPPYTMEKVHALDQWFDY
jgi:hypothetical protein